MALYAAYFDDWEVKPQFDRAYVSLWPGWLGPAGADELDQVTQSDWGKFNKWLKLVANDHEMHAVNCKLKSTSMVADIEKVPCSYQASMNKTSNDFDKFILPGLSCVITEDWDYTYIIWHKNDGAIEKLMPSIASAELFKFTD